MASPNVPNAPGVPALNRIGQAIIPNVLLLIADARAVLALFQSVRWGIFDQNGRPVIIGDSVKAVDFADQSRISDFPVEQGAFSSYNKVENPFDIRVVFTKGGSVSERTQFLNAIKAAKKSLALFQVVTPEITYLNVNVVHYDYRRTQRQGATLLTVDVGCREIRSAPALQFSNTQAPDGAGQVNDGTVQAQPPTPDQTTVIQHGATGSW
jgi:hypothetical protein